MTESGMTKLNLRPSLHGPQHTFAIMNGSRNHFISSHLLILPLQMNENI